MRKIATILVTSIALAGSLSVRAVADDYRGNWHGDIQHFDEYDAARWHGGYWTNHFHDGRSGWWWVVDAGWYYYPSPVYPYPDPYIPYTVIMQHPAPAAAPQYWYCSNPAGYYPYVAACYMPWQPVSTEVQKPVITQKPAVDLQAQRDKDDRELNKLAGEFYGINVSDKDALEHIKSLKVRAGKFHQTLFSRNYNAMDILKDTENLEKRIAAKETEISGKPANLSPASGHI